MPLLEIRGLIKRFIGVTAVDRVDLAVERGELISLIGPNGSGKTTLFNCVTGYLAADGGRVPYVAPADPCNCDPSTFFDVAAAVAAAKTAANGLPSFGVGSFAPHLASGNYYAPSAQVVGVFVIGAKHTGDTPAGLGPASAPGLYCPRW